MQNFVDLVGKYDLTFHVMQRDNDPKDTTDAVKQTGRRKQWNIMWDHADREQKKRKSTSKEEL